MANTLTTKEKMLLKDLKSQEEICIQKYSNYAQQTQCPQLKQILTTHAQHEQQHLNTINQILNGQIPTMPQGNQQQSQANQQQTQFQGTMQQNQQQMGMQFQQQQQGTPQQQYTPQLVNGKNLEEYICTDLLSTEKYVSSTYDTAIFEFTNPQIRQVLNHIQKEEQQHGEEIFLYMQSNGMYNPQ
ncbi:MAG: spore coat protein [Peptococcia bacterium]